MENCKTKFIPNYTKRISKFAKRFSKKWDNKCLKMLKSPTTSAKNNKFLVSICKKTKTKKSVSNKTKKMYERVLEKGFCNPGCKGTIFQDNVFPQKEIEQDYLNNHTIPRKYKTKKEINSFTRGSKAIRSSIFNGQKSVLKNSFYNGLTQKTIKSLKRDGALSGCAVSTLK